MIKRGEKTMTNKQKVGILTRFFFKWVLPRVWNVMAVLFILWLVYSVVEIGFADSSQIGRDYWDYNLICLLMGR